MTPDFPFTRDIVLVGGGHTHALVLRRWGMTPLAGARLTLINPGPTAPYSGMLPGHVAGHYTRAELDIDLVRLCRFAGARLIDGRATGIDLAARNVTVDGGREMPFDVLSLDIGITSEMDALPGFADHAVPAKPLGRFAAAWEDFVTQGKGTRVAILGGGVAGAELALAASHRLQSAGREAEVHLIDRGTILRQIGDSARRLMLDRLEAYDVTLWPDSDVTRITDEGVVLAVGTTIATDFVIGAAGATPQPWLERTGLALHEGFVSVGPTLATSDPLVFAVGDCAHLSHAPRPKAGVFAVRAAPILYENLRAAASGTEPSRYDPQRDYLKLISLGRQEALAEKWGTAVAGPLLWRWKNRIDRAFMARFDPLPQMDKPALPWTHAAGLKELTGAAPMCGGCGSKVGRDALAVAVTDGSYDDAARLDGGTLISTDHLRGFWEDPAVMTRIAAVHALGDIWAMGGKPEAMLPQIILPRMSPALQRRTLAEIMEAARGVAETAGARIVGGHTSQGAEFHIGFTVTGRADRPIGLAGAAPGDALILTKPLGSGTIMAAEMRGAATGQHVLAALALMQQDQAAASDILRGAHAMTDVTGFGLAGHLWGICTASGVGVDVTLADLHLMPGAEALAENGIRSSLWPDNRAAVPVIVGPDSARFALLFDPQTAGGLLAAVAEGEAQSVLAKLKAAGYDARLIGRVTEGPAAITCR